MIKKMAVIAYLIFISNFAVADQMPSDDELFSETPQIIESTNLKDSLSMNEEEKKSVSFSGEITNTSSYIINRDFIAGKGNFNNNKMINMVTGNLMLDVRLKKGVKAFANLQAGYLPTATTNLAIDLKEIFVDANYNRKAYFRMGKQALAWGRGYFWNPTDLINIEKKSFVKEAGYNSGVYGLKIDIPFGTKLNIYEFLNVSDSLNTDEIAFASKVEFLLDNTEISLSNWLKKDMKPIFGVDFSSRIFNVDIRGEGSFSKGSNVDRVEIIDGKLKRQASKEDIIPKISLGFTKAFDIGDIKERLSITGEFYYNGAGYCDNIFSKEKTYFSEEIKTNITRFNYMSLKGLYEENNFNRYYFGFNGSYAKFISNDVTLICNGVLNMNDWSVKLITGVAYSDLNDLSLGLNLINNLGPDEREYTYNGTGMTIQGTAGISF